MIIAFTLESVVNGGHHANVGISIDAGPTQTMLVSMDDMRIAQSQPDINAAIMAALSAKIAGAPTNAAAADLFPFSVTL